ncbi:MarR family winged helix-turn-helix transcriptional regulator [Pseudomonas antarctica]|uniref:MarR family winged helix-turn-helix transcriptional regulator n=1 Tax=Pseudomonas antarctica TaxID=219572 RepID=UPI00345CD7F6
MNVEQLKAYSTTPAGHDRIFNPQRMVDMLDYRLYLVYRDCGHVTETLCKKEFGINRRRWRIIASLTESEGSTVSQLAQHAELDMAQTSRTIGTLMREGYLRRLSNPDNARFAKVVLTDKGRDLYKSLFERYSDANQKLLGVLSPEEMTQLDGLINKLRINAFTINNSLSIQENKKSTLSV